MADLISFKGYRDGITLILDDSEPDFRKILNQLKVKLSYLSFFKDAVVNIDIGQRRSLSPEQLTSLEDVLSAKNIQVRNLILNGEKPKIPNHSPAPSEKTAKNENLMVSRTIRSGQSLSYPGSIVLIGDVHPGGEVIARENVIVWGTLSGVVHAGCGGNPKAFIIALHLVPAQLRIAQHIACASEQHPDLPRTPKIAYLQDNRIVIEEYNSTKNILSYIT